MPTHRTNASISAQADQPNHTWAELHALDVGPETAAELMRCSVPYAQEQYRREAIRAKRAKQIKRAGQQARKA